MTNHFELLNGIVGCGFQFVTVIGIPAHERCNICKHSLESAAIGLAIGAEVIALVCESCAARYVE